jgi:hypothetical protein
LGVSFWIVGNWVMSKPCASFELFIERERSCKMGHQISGSSLGAVGVHSKEMEKRKRAPSGTTLSAGKDIVYRSIDALL